MEFDRWPTHNIRTSTGNSWCYTGLMAMVFSLLHWALKTLTATKSIPRVWKRLKADVTTAECPPPWRAHSLVQLLVSDLVRNRNQIIPLISNIVPKSIGVPIPRHAWISARAFNYLQTTSPGGRHAMELDCGGAACETHPNSQEN